MFCEFVNDWMYMCRNVCFVVGKVKNLFRSFFVRLVLFVVSIVDVCDSGLFVDRIEREKVNFLNFCMSL